MLTIRYEKIGMIIYSTKLKNYFFTNDSKTIDDCRRLFHGGSVDNIPLLKELKELGIDEGIREVECPQNDYALSAPLEYYFDFTNKCNLKCAHCYNKDNINSITMPNEKIQEIIKDMYNCGIMRIHLAGGEPTTELYGLNTYLSTAKKYGIVSSMSTNGVCLPDEAFDIMLENNLFSITISLEGATEEENARVRGKGNFYKSLNTIKKLVELKKVMNLKTIICIKMSYYTNVTYQQLENMVKLGIALGVDVVKLANPERCVFHEKGFYGNVYDDYYKVTDYIKDIKEKYGKYIHISDVANPINNCGEIGLPNMKGCIGAQELIAINPDGRISPCLMNQIYLGNIYDYSSIRDFWLNNENLKRYRDSIANYDCSNCSLHSNCRGGCQVRKFVEYGKIEGIDPLCPIKKHDTELVQSKENGNLLKKVKVLHSL